MLTLERRVWRLRHRGQIGATRDPGSVGSARRASDLPAPQSGDGEGHVTSTGGTVWLALEES